MAWGNLLLVSALRNFGYQIATMFFRFLLQIWSGIAAIVDGIEGVFRRLAGLDAGENGITDMAGEIMNSGPVQTIFGNLVGLSIALLIFFTIVKILQQQYKEKQGGNPYIIVFRMFKGMLMFFFVTAAVLVGLYASGVVFRALDDATKSGATSISGQIFQAMAYDANRKRMSDDGEEIDDGDEDKETMGDFYYARLTDDPAYKKMGNGKKCTMVTMTGDSPSNAQAQAYYDNLPENNWVMVNADGSETPLKVAISGFSEDIKLDSDKYTPNLGGYGSYLAGEGSAEAGVENGRHYGAVGYKNDILSSVTTLLQPAIDVKWSPIALKETTYALRKAENVVPTDITISVLGSGTTIHMGYASVKYECTHPYTKLAISEDNLFSINLKGRASLQGSEVAASYTFDAYAVDLPVEKIMMTIIVQNMLAKLLEVAVESIPEMPVWWHVGPVAVNLVSLCATLLGPVFDKLFNSAIYVLTIGAVEDASQFVEVGKSTALPLTWRKYDLFDTDNWKDLWGQVCQNLDDLLDQLNQYYEEDDFNLNQGLKMMEKNTQKLQKQGSWAQYKSLVDDYNSLAAKYLKAIVANADKYADPNYTSSYGESERKEIEDGLTGAWNNLVTEYLVLKGALNKVSTSLDPASTVLKQIYKPAFTHTYNESNGTNFTPAQILDELKNGTNCKFNLVKDPSGFAGKVFRVVDWSLYAKEVETEMKGIADVYEEDDLDSYTYLESKYLTPANFTLGIKFDANKKLVSDKSSNIFDPERTEADFNGTAAASAANYRSSSVKSLSTSTVNDSDDYTATVDEWLNTPLDGTTNGGDNATVSDNVAEKQSAGETLWQEMVAKLQTAETTPVNSSGDTGGRDIVTFRRVDNGLKTSKKDDDEVSRGKEIKTLKKWIKTKQSLQLAAGATIKPLYDMSADEIDYYMGQRDNARRYLTVADGNDPTNAKSQEQYYGIMSYTDGGTVKALYEMRKINYVIGYMGIVVALGVYMNFTFGLVQRAVNLSVLYVMSPLSIAFYPFDDGQRFKNQFVVPFYKEAISAYAIIISLNIFVVLFKPVKDAAANAAGSFVGFIAMVTFVSMLPKIRDSITGMLGANSITAKSLNDIFKDAGNTLSDPFKQIDGFRKSASDRLKKMQNSKLNQFRRGLKDRGFKNAAGRRAKKMAELKEKFDAREALSKRNKKKLEKWNKLKQRQENIKAAALAGKDSDAFKNLSKRDQRQAKRLQRTAAEQAKKDLAAQNLSEAQLAELAKNGKGEEKEAAEKRLAELRKRAEESGKSVDELLQEDRQNELMNDTKFASSVSGILSKKTRKPTNGLVQGLKDKFQYRLLGNAFETLFNPATGMLANSDTFIGRMMKWSSPVEQNKRLAEMTQKEAEYRAAKYDVDEVKTKQLTASCEAMLQADETKKDTIKRAAAIKQAAATETDPKKQKEMAENLYRGVGGAEIDEKYMTAAAEDFEKMTKMDIDSLKATKKDLSAENKDSIKAMVKDMTKKLNISAEAAKGLDELVVDAVNNGDSMETITCKIMGHLPEGTVEEATLKAHLNKKKFADKITEMQFDLGAENAMVNGVLEHAKKIDKAREWAFQDLNVDITSNDFQNYFQAYCKMFDKNTEGSLIQMEDELRKKYNGDINNPAYKRELNALEAQFSKEYDKAFKSVGNRAEVRMYDYSVRQLEREQAERTVVVAKQWQKRYKYHMEVNMSTTAKNVVATDTVIREMKRTGDYQGAANVMNAAIDAAIRKDYTALANMKIDEVTKQQFKTWAEAGESGLKELRSITEYNDLTRKFMGNAEGISGGESTQAVRNQMAAIFRIMENKEISDFLDGQIKTFGAQEGSLRAQLAQYHKTALNEFSGSTWQKAMEAFDLRDENGNKISNLGEYVNDIVTRIEQKTLSPNSEAITDLVNKLSIMEGEWGAHPELESVMKANQASGHLTKALNAINQAMLANEYSDKVDLLHKRKNETTRDAFEHEQKVMEDKK